MPLKKGKNSMGYNLHELAMDNKKKGKAKGANGKPRSRKQMLAIAMSMTKKS